GVGGEQAHRVGLTRHLDDGRRAGRALDVGIGGGQRRHRALPLGLHLALVGADDVLQILGLLVDDRALVGLRRRLVGLGILALPLVADGGLATVGAAALL